MAPPDSDLLSQVLEESRRRGFLGTGPVDAHISHAERFVTAIGRESAATVLDLGSGGGVPGLVLAFRWPESTIFLLDAADRRTSFLFEAVQTLGVDDRVHVIRGRAEEIAHRDEFRGRFDIVVARSFGPPAVVAECAAGFLHVGGNLVVSEPPEDDGERWPHDGLDRLGMKIVSVGGGTVVISQQRACPERFPRRVGVPAKRPLF